jgi:hypothetical protein
VSRNQQGKSPVQARTDFALLEGHLEIIIG